MRDAICAIAPHDPTLPCHGTARRSHRFLVLPVFLGSVGALFLPRSSCRGLIPCIPVQGDNIDLDKPRAHETRDAGGWG